MDTIRSLYKTNPEFVRDILHLHFFNTWEYHSKRMNAFGKLRISSKLKIQLQVMLKHVTSYTTMDNGNYKFETKTSFIGMPVPIPFPPLFNSLIHECYTAEDIVDMYNKMYKSKKPILVHLAEEFKNEDISLSKELFDFIKRKECDTMKSWQISEIQTGSWNYTLLSLNKNVWETAFDSQYVSQIFQHEKKELDKIDESKLLVDFKSMNDGTDENTKYIERVNKLIQQKLN